MTGQAILFMLLGATILWGGLAVTLMIHFKKEKE